MDVVPLPLNRTYIRRMYLADVIILNSRVVIRIRKVTVAGTFLVGYFRTVGAINDGGRPIELADLVIMGFPD